MRGIHASAFAAAAVARQEERAQMLYEVRYRLNGDEQTMLVEAETAATAVEEVHHRLRVGEEGFELIQITLVDDQAADERVIANE